MSYPEMTAVGEPRFPWQRRCRAVTTVPFPGNHGIVLGGTFRGSLCREFLSSIGRRSGSLLEGLALRDLPSSPARGGGELSCITFGRRN